ncbi:MAG: restriction endonuclease, partial [Acidobacteriota bacterium]
MTNTSPTIDAMHKLRPSGDRSFEELVARLLSRVSGVRIRRCKAGSQGGVDALGEIPFAIETKRYDGNIRTRELLGGLASAAQTYRELELWTLIATCEISAQTQSDLKKEGLSRGIAVLVLDTLPAPDLADAPSLVALAASDIVTTMGVLGDPDWRVDGLAPDLAAIRVELARIHSLPQFGAWQARLRKELRELPTWHRLVRAQNERVLERIAGGDAYIAFGTRYDPTEAVARSVETQLSVWRDTCATSGACPVAVVTGDRYDGKTWLVYRWLSENLDRLTVPVFFLSSRDVLAVRGDLKALLIREAEDALETFADHAKAVVERQRSAAGTAPWCIVILDGANEYVADPQALGKAVLWAVPSVLKRFLHGQEVAAGEAADDRPRRPCGVLVTCRARDFEEDSSWLGSRSVKQIELGPYDEEEFLKALQLRFLDPTELEHLPPAALEMIHHPRYLDLMLRHRNELEGFAGITVDVLHYLDATDKVARSHTAFRDILGRLARAWKPDRRLNRAAIHEHLRAVSDQVDRDLRALTSEGVLTQQRDGTYMPHPERLALGMGLFIRDELLSMRDAAALPQKLADFLEPNREDDEKVRWLRAAVTASLLAGDADGSPRLMQVLLAAWLSARNFSESDLADLRNLSPLVLKPLMQLVSSSIPRTSNVLLFAEAVITAELDRNEEAVAEALRWWVRIVPTGTRLTFDGDEEPLANATHQIEDPSFRDLGLALPEDGAGKFVINCQRLALFLACLRPSLMRPVDILALYASRDVGYDPLDSGERFAVRTIIAESGPEWFEREVREWTAKPEAPRSRLLRDFIYFSQRKASALARSDRGVLVRSDQV